jgi:hypothetical protein
MLLAILFLMSLALRVARKALMTMIIHPVALKMLPLAAITRILMQVSRRGRRVVMAQVAVVETTELVHLFEEAAAVEASAIQSLAWGA